MKPLTDKQRDLLVFIRGYIDQYGWSPTLREIGRATGNTSTNAVSEAIDRLVAKGYLAKDPMKSRAVRVLRDIEGSVVSETQGQAVSPNIVAQQNKLLRAEITRLRKVMTGLATALLEESDDRLAITPDKLYVGDVAVSLTK